MLGPMEVVHVTDQVPERRSARHCPDCGALGILPLAQRHTPDGGIQDPVLICPVCSTEFWAVGVKWLGALKPPSDWASLPRSEQKAAAEEMASIWWPRLSSNQNAKDQ